MTAKILSRNTIVAMLIIGITSGCAMKDNNMVTGAAIGGALGSIAGGLIGAQTGNAALGAAIGAGIGGAFGLATGYYLDMQEAKSLQEAAQKANVPSAIQTTQVKDEKTGTVKEEF
ncbi:MAG: Glycine zipper, partial [Pseudomonadota bacterium]